MFIIIQVVAAVMQQAAIGSTEVMRQRESAGHWIRFYQHLKHN